MSIESVPQPGDVVLVRSRPWLVESVDSEPVASDSPVVQLSCLQDDSLGEMLQVLWDHEVDAVIPPERKWESVVHKGFEEPRTFAAYLHTLRWSSVTSTDAKLLQAPYRAGIDVKSYQLEPLRRALSMPRVNLFIADDVGLGKTIEAGLVLREMLIRQKVRRVVVACPPAVLLQWRDEMEQRFGLSFVVLDRNYFQQMRQERGYGTNPWTTHVRFVVSHALLRDPTYEEPLRAWLERNDGPAMLILDEAHHVAPASGTKYAVDSALTQAVRRLAPLFQHRLFLSATPHNGHSNSFSALLEILDPQRFVRGTAVGKDNKQLNAVMVRRLKKDLRGLSDDFPERKVVRHALMPGPNAPEIRLSRLLDEYAALRDERMQSLPAGKRASAGLVITSLQKRLLSSTNAFARTLEVHRRSVEKALAGGPSTALGVSEIENPEQLRMAMDAPDGDDDRAEASEEFVEAKAEAAVTKASRALASVVPPSVQEKKVLEELTALARKHRDTSDSRFDELVKWLRASLCPKFGEPDAKWEDRRVIIFTEYADTKDWLRRQFEAVLEDPDEARDRIATFHGGMSDDARQKVIDGFNEDPIRHPLRILIATDAAREGVNLQNHCADLFHFDIPWNPGRMEQRNGRIDRRLQRSKEVRCHYFVLPERAQDRVLEVLVRKSDTIVQQLGSFPPVVQRNLEKILALGIRPGQVEGMLAHIERVDAKSGDSAVAVIEEELEASRTRRDKAAKEIEELDVLLEKSRQWLAFDEVHFREALSVALESNVRAPLNADADDAPDLKMPRWKVPESRTSDMSQASWDELLDTLRRPRRPKEYPQQWRRDAPIRPLVFHDPGNIDGRVAHVHLEHRFARRLLDRFLAQGFQEDTVKRACVVRSKTATPRVAVLARVSLHGDGAARLHDVLVPIVADWKDPSTRKGSLRPTTGVERDAALAELEASFTDPQMHVVPDGVKRTLLASAKRDVADLEEFLRDRLAAEIARAEKDLATRGEKEAKEMQAILLDQKKRIEAQQAVAIEKSQQLALPGVDADERAQLKADQDYWLKRLDRIPLELVEEPRKIREAYVVRTRRIEPVGLVYLWPLSS